MTSNPIKDTPSQKKYLYWGIGVCFLLFQFFLQLSSGIVIGVIMKEQQLSAFIAGLLSSSFYYVYTTMQIPVGLMFDRYNTRLLLSTTAAICALGCFLFAHGQSLTLLFLGRFIIGGGSAFAFVGLTQILRHHFPLNRYAFLIGATETFGFTFTVIGMISMGSWISHLGWRVFLVGCGFIGLFIAFLCYFFLPKASNGPEHTELNQIKPRVITQLKELLKNKLAWLNGLFVGLEFSVITVFAAMWAVPFLELKLDCHLKLASILTAMILLGAGLSCPIYGQLSLWSSKRNPLIHASCWSTTILLLIVLFAPIHNLFLMGTLLFLIGLCCGAYMLAFSIANELAPRESLSTCTGFTNTLAMLSAPILQPAVGYLLDHLRGTSASYSLAHYQLALLILPAALILASGLACFLPEKQ